MPMEKAAILVNALQIRLQHAPEKFIKLVQILMDHSLIYTMNVTEIIRSEFGKSVYSQCTPYLKWLYADLVSQKLSYNNQCVWSSSACMKFFELAMIETAAVQTGKIDDEFVRLSITGKVDDILKLKHPINLETIFKESKGQRKVVLLEGAPGCGKSTLSVYICQQWEKGQLFNQFALVILVQLQDPAIKYAKGLGDLLPCSNAKTAQLLAGIILEMKCQDVLFILDGWDELPFHLRKKSIFNSLISSNLPSSNPFSRSSVIVTSRPIASSDLHRVVSSRIEILGFTAEKLCLFFTECLKGDSEAVKTLLERIEENSIVAGSCYLPLNATILAHLFKSGHYTLPTTLHGTFSNLVVNCIKCQCKDVSIESLDQLPEFVMELFLVLCQLAYNGVMEDKTVFTSLPPDTKLNTLGLLQEVNSLTGRKKSVSHSFIHLSLQEFMAAWYLATQVQAEEQVTKVNELFNKSCFSAVLKFYAAITKLKSPRIKNVVVNIVKKCESKVQESLTLKEDGTLLLSLLHCLYEAQDPSLCKFVAQQLQHGLNFSDSLLTPTDCLCIGYFLAHVCMMTTGEFQVDLNSCGICDLGCKYLVMSLHKYLGTHTTTTLLNMDMRCNEIGHQGAHHLSTLLKIGCVNYLNMNENSLLLENDKAIIHNIAPFGTFAEQLKNNNTLTELWLMKCGLNSQSAKSLAKALATNTHLKELYIGDNAVCDDGTQYLANALRVNRGLKMLDMGDCGMTDVGLTCLAKSLQNNLLNRVLLWNFSSNSNTPNIITEEIVPALTDCLKNNNNLIRLELPRNLKSSTASIEKAANNVRKRNGLPLITVSGMHM